MSATNRKLPPTFPPPSRGGAPEWAQYRPGTSGIPVDLIGEEQNALRRFSPRRNRWAKVAEFDERVLEVDRRRTELQARIQELGDRISQAATADREALAAWALEEKGPRPEPTLPGLEAERDALLSQSAALSDVETGILEEKAAYIKRHCKRLIRDADAETTKLRGRYESLVAEIASVREELIAARQTTIWAACYGTPVASESVPTANLMAGLAEPLRRIPGRADQLAADTVWAALTEDANVLRSVGTYNQLEALGQPVRDRKATWQNGQVDFVGPRFAAAWSGSPEEKEEADRARAYTEAQRRHLWGDS